MLLLICDESIVLPYTRLHVFPTEPSRIEDPAPGVSLSFHAMRHAPGLPVLLFASAFGGASGDISVVGWSGALPLSASERGAYRSRSRM